MVTPTELSLRSHRIMGKSKRNKTRSRLAKCRRSTREGKTVPSCPAASSHLQKIVRQAKRPQPSEPIDPGPIKQSLLAMCSSTLVYLNSRPNFAAAAISEP